MKVTFEMDCMTLTMVRADDKPVWKATVTSTLDPDKGEQKATVELNDNEAAATAALACGVNLPDGDATEKALYAMTNGVWDGGLRDKDLCPIP